MPPVLQIVFENVDAVYAPGQTVVGAARMHFDKRTKARCMKMNINGKGHFHHTEGKTHYITREPYVDMDVIFTQPLGTTQEEFYIEPGDYVYPFSFLLAKNLPSSFTYTQGKLCTIKYIIKLVVVKPWSFDDKIEREIIIREQFDITDNLLLGLPFAYDGLINEYTFFCCNKRTVNASIILKRRKNTLW